VRLLRGELGDALQSSASALTIAEHNDIAFILPVLGSQVGYLLSMQGRKTEGLELARRAVRKAEEIGINAGRSRWTARLAEACLIADEVGEARRHARSALDAANDGREQGYLCSALRLHAKLCVAEGKLDQAAADLRDATKIARRLRLGPALAKCHFDAGALALRGGHLTEARRALALAGRSFRSYGMPAATARVAVALARAKAGSSGSAFDDFFGSAE